MMTSGADQNVCFSLLIAPNPPVRFRVNRAFSASAVFRPSQSFLATRRPSQSRRSLDAHPLVLNVGSGAESSQNKGAARSNPNASNRFRPDPVRSFTSTPGLGPARAQEKADLFKESIGSRLMLEEQVVSTREDNETGFGDACGQLATRLEGSYDVVPHMHDKRRRLHF